MKIDAKYLLQSLKKVAASAARKSALPICECVHLKIENVVLTLEATNLSQKFTEIIQLEEPAPQNVDIAVNIELFKKALEGVDGFCYIDYKKFMERIIISDDNTRFELSGYAGEDFPEVGRNQEVKNEFKIAAHELKRLLNATAFCCSDDDLKPQMCGVHFQVSATKIKATATDSHKLAHGLIENKLEVEADFNFTLDREGAKVLLSILPDDERVIHVFFGDKFVKFNFNNSYFSSLLQAQNFPQFEGIMKKEGRDYKVEVNRLELTKGIKKIISFAKSETRLIKFTFKNESLYLVAEDVEKTKTGSAKVGAKNINTEPLTIGFNGQYLIDVLNHLQNDTVIFMMSTPSTAVIIENLGYSALEQTMLVMPIMLNDLVD